MVDFAKMLQVQHERRDGRRVLVCGDREWRNYARILACMRKANATEKIQVIIEGECRGADLMGRRAAEEIGLSVDAGTILPFPADWKAYALAAGPIRNQRQLTEGKPTEVWAFHDTIERSVGTLDMINRSLKAGKKVYHITSTSWKLLAIEKGLFD